MNKDLLVTIFKKNMSVFINEYSKYLDREQLDKLKNIDYDKVVSIDDIKVPFGVTLFDKIYLSKTNEELLESLKKMPNYNTKRYELRSKNLSSYIRYMCENGYSLTDLYSDIILYFIFDLVIKNPSFLIKGFINQEIEFLSIKYNVRSSSLYQREERIATSLTNIFSFEEIRNILFKSEIDAYSYLIDKYGYRYANLFYNVCILANTEYDKIKNKDYRGVSGLLEYVDAYDNISYGDIYNYLLDFEIENNIR